jgi:hypothetical protein
VAVPAGTYSPEPGHIPELHDQVLEDLVQGGSDVDMPVGGGPSCRMYLGRSLEISAAYDRSFFFPFSEFRFELGEAAFMEKKFSGRFKVSL